MTAGAAQEQRIHVIQGEHQVSGDPLVCLTTVLGSCVAACIWDAEARVGGMNHFLLPEAPDGAIEDRRYGVHAMELLINSLLTRGASRRRLRAKAFGGGRMTHSMTDIGGRNEAFIRRFLIDEAIMLEAESLGGDQARRVQFWPATGRARLHRISAPTIPLVARVTEPRTGDLELF